MTTRDLSTPLLISLSVMVVFLMGLGTGVLLDSKSSGFGATALKGPRYAGLGSQPGRQHMMGKGPEFSRGRQPGRQHMMGRGRGTGRMLHRLGTALELSEEQSERLEVLSRTQREQFGEIRRDRREQLKTQREAFRTSVAEILTPTQMELFENMRGRGRGR